MAALATTVDDLVLSFMAKAPEDQWTDESAFVLWNAEELANVGLALVRLPDECRSRYDARMRERVNECIFEWICSTTLIEPLRDVDL